MNPTSLSIRTDLIFWRHDGRVSDRGEYLVVETPSNPGYYWGNLLIFDRPPEHEDLRRWPEIFAREFAHEPGVRHMTFQWDTVTGELGAAVQFAELGFRRSFCHVLQIAADQLAEPPHFDAGLRIAPVTRDAEWEAIFEIKLAIARVEHEERAYREFLTRRLRDFRTMIAEGLGVWFGAFSGDRLVGDAGLFFDGSLGRFQEVETHPAFRRRGVCGTLVHEMARYAFAERGADILVIVADDDEFQSASVYRTVGFQHREQIPGLCRYPGE